MNEIEAKKRVLYLVAGGLVVEVKDGFGNPVRGARVSLAATVILTLALTSSLVAA
mgnify:CR=1 FL=1